MRRVVGGCIGLLLMASGTFGQTAPDLGTGAGSPAATNEKPALLQPGFTLEKWADTIKEPTSMAWLDDGRGPAPPDGGTLLVLEKWTGLVRQIQRRSDHATLLPEPAARIHVNFKEERGLLGIAVHPKFADNHWVYLFYTESDRDRIDGRSDIHRGQKIVRFTWQPVETGGGKLVEPKTILEFPYEPRAQNGPNSCGGKILFGPDGKLYGIFGDQNRHGLETNEHRDGLTSPGGGRIGAGIIFRLSDDGTTPADNPWADHKDVWIQRYFAVGVRNGFGLAFDPVTQMLWDTENGPETWDELNLVRPKFNSGWAYIMGPLSSPLNADRKRTEVLADKILGTRYADPVLSWYRCRGLTCLAFVDTGAYGPGAKNTLLIGEVNGGWLMQVRLNSARDRVDAQSAGLRERIILGDTLEEVQKNSQEIMFATGVGGITDIQKGPDGLLYMCSYRHSCVYVLRPGVGQK